MNKKEQLTTIEIEDRTVEGAIQKAMNALKVSRDDIKVKILKEEKRGLFGMEGAVRAKIRVTVKKPGK
ncbi:MAG: Jag N-terminal domain-containing protein [Candidatus Omnitrophica bacterium]|nr:Jag N-terminal domain-containing protein [Candidatus Omnitrophota bacterium]MBU1128717.1 Jag N-terminal domain-containing protein [Candidatus Omnitrophota bacterium]MBU1656920.1 Jag N-terminal domain-containing protein [Candidatus Omnitrophota bacterium]MBU1784832.1 Jag N-terminal domain-containing protein [Candidatus Omnitrophota bacterium]MBU1850996.1 Jag N-terminal domain-containing protein [Candidatus Omnitrophota bacterium]